MTDRQEVVRKVRVKKDSRINKQPRHKNLAHGGYRNSRKNHEFRFILVHSVAKLCNDWEPQLLNISSVNSI